MDEILAYMRALEEQCTPKFPFISLNILYFIEEIKAAAALINRAGATFIDIGCGIGNKMLLASRYGFRTTGIDISPEYLAVAESLVKHGSYRSFDLIQADALTYDYSNFDVIYFYCPCSDPKKEKTLERRIIDTAKSGALVIANCVSDISLPPKEWNKPPMRRVWDNKIFQKEVCSL